MAEKIKPRSNILSQDATRKAESSDGCNSSENLLEVSGSTRADMRDMARMGHKQQLIRQYTMWKSTAFICVAMASWELTIFTLNAGLVASGRAGLLWSFIWCFVGFVPVFLSMAEMSSMAPIAGSQYHWVSEFGPDSDSLQRKLSYFTGWMSVLAWQAGNAVGILLTAQLVQSMAQIAYPDTYVPEAYHITLITIGVCILTFLANFYANSLLPKIQNFLFAGHIITFVILIISIGVMAPKATSAQVWTDFEGTGGWKTLALGVLAGQTSGISANTGADTAGHLAEEIMDASLNVPRTMLAAFGVNGVLSIAVVLIICYAMPDLDTALADPTSFPAIYVLRQTMSTPCLLAFLAFANVLLFASNVNYMVAVSRDLWAFARDKGTPFPNTLARVSSTRHIPTAANAVSCAISGLLSILYIGSTTAYYAVVSLFLVAILPCYLLTIGCLLWRRVFRPGTLPRSRFSLGPRWGIPINVVALIWCVWAFFWSFWPQSDGNSSDGDGSSQGFSVADMNWACVLFGTTVVFAGLLYVFSARHVYRGPVHLVAGRMGNASLDEDEYDEQEGERDSDGGKEKVLRNDDGEKAAGLQVRELVR